MHYCVLVYTKEFPTDEAIGNALEPYKYKDGGYDEGEQRPLFTWDWWQVGCPYEDDSTDDCKMYEDALALLREQEAVAPSIGGWISVKERLPEEKESIFAKFHATEKWSRAMWQKESETVLVGVAFQDGGQKVTVGRLHDGKWSTTVSQVIPHTVTHWQPLPEPPKEYQNENH